MEIGSFKDMFVAELQELASVEAQLADALLRMAGAASHPALKRAAGLSSRRNGELKGNGC